MAMTQVAEAPMAPLELYQDSDLQATAQAISDGPKTLESAHIDNTGNADDGNDLTFFKAYDINAPVIGTTEPAVVLPIEEGLKLNFVLDHLFPNGLAVACVKNVGVADGPGGSGSTNPDASVPCEVITD